MEGTKGSKKDTPTREKAAPGLVEELEALRSAYAKSVEQMQAKFSSATEEGWTQYFQSSNEIAVKTAQAWIESCAAYLDAYQKLPAQPDNEALEPVRNAWAGHVKACVYTPDIAQAVRAAQQKLYDALKDAHNSAAETINAAAKSCFESLHAALSAHGLANLDPAAVQFVTYQIAAINAAAPSST